MSSPKLLDQVRTVARVKHYSRKTEDAYANWIKRFILFHKKRHPKEMAEEEIRQFLAYLAVDLQVSSSTQTVPSARYFSYIAMCSNFHFPILKMSNVQSLRADCLLSFQKWKCKPSSHIFRARTFCWPAYCTALGCA